MVENIGGSAHLMARDIKSYEGLVGIVAWCMTGEGTSGGLLYIQTRVDDAARHARCRQSKQRLIGVYR